MSAEKIIEQILSARPEIARKEILEKLEMKKSKTGGFISDAVLLRMIAAEFSVEIPQDVVLTPTLSIGDLILSLNDVTLIGRVVAVFPPKAFKGDRSGKVASLLVADQSSILRVVLWDDKTNFIESGEIKVGQVIRFSHGYTREDWSGRVELHIGEKSGIEINPQGVEAKDYPTIGKFTTKIREITQAQKNKRVSIKGKVKELFPASTFTRQDSSSGKVMRFVLADETGEVHVVVWNEKTSEFENVIKKDVKLQVVNAKVKKAMNEGLEIHVDAGTYVETLIPEEEFLKIADLKEGSKSVNVEGEVLTKPILRDVKTSKGELVKLANFELKDETGRMWVSAWRMLTDSVNDLKVGDRIVLKNVYVKKGFGDELEISTRNTTSIVKQGIKSQN
jgi:ssDNA-binding replication factor A large subunit